MNIHIQYKRRDCHSFKRKLWHMVQKWQNSNSPLTFTNITILIHLAEISRMYSKSKCVVQVTGLEQKSSRPGTTSLHLILVSEHLNSHITTSSLDLTHFIVNLSSSTWPGTTHFSKDLRDVYNVNLADLAKPQNSKNWIYIQKFKRFRTAWTWTHHSQHEKPLWMNLKSALSWVDPVVLYIASHFNIIRTTWYKSVNT